jgi:CHAT domain-containing protein
MSLSYTEIDSLVYLEYKNRAYQKAIVYIQAGRDKSKAEFGEVDSVFAEYTSNLGFFYKQIAQYEKARQLLLQARDLSAKVYGKEHPIYALTLSNLGNLFREMGYYEKAETFYLEAAKIRAKVLGKEHPKYAITLNNLGNLYQDMGSYEKAEAVYLQSKEIRAKVFGEEHPKYARGLGNLGSLYNSMNLLEKAEPLFLLALNINIKAYGESNPRNADVLTSLGSLYRKMKNYNKAEEFYIKAKNLNLKHWGEEHPTVAGSFMNLAGLYQKINNNTKAEKLYLKAKSIYSKSLGKEHPDFSIVLNNLAFLYQGIDNNKKAEELYIQAKKIRAKTLGKENPKYATSLNNLASLYFQTEKLDTALIYILKSIDANSPMIDSSILTLNSREWSKLAEVEYYSNHIASTSLQIFLLILKAQYNSTGEEKKLKEHYQLSKIAMQLNERLRNDLRGEQDKLRLLNSNAFFIKHGIETAVLLGKDVNKQEAFNFAEQNKSVLLSDAVKGNRARVLGDLPEALIIEEINLQNQIFKLKQKQFQAKTEEEERIENQKLSTLQSKRDVFLKSIKNKYPKYHAFKYENTTTTAVEVQALLDKKTALIEYFLSDSICYLFLITPSEVQLYPIQIKLHELKKRIKTFQRALSDYTMIVKNKDRAYKSYTEIAHWFYKELLEVALKNKNLENLIIVADGELGHLPFETFLVEAAKEQNLNYKTLHFLLNDYNISYNYSATLWKENLSTTNHSNNGKILACASNYPSLEYWSDSSSSSLKKMRLPYFSNLRANLQPLPAAEKEIKILSENFQGDFLFENAANEKDFKKIAANYSVIHLAMHGILESSRPMLSSLVFTENRDSLEDNLLQAYEISRLKLNAGLVVLSACETGYGKFEQGEGIVSLARSFMYAGVPSLVVSLWQVNDQSTAMVMENFYKNLASGMNKAVALRKAKLSYIKNTEGILAHPAFWSPFIQLGNSKTISLSRKSNPWFWGITGVAILFVVGGFFMIRRKQST